MLERLSYKPSTPFSNNNHNTEIYLQSVIDDDDSDYFLNAELFKEMYTHKWQPIQKLTQPKIPIHYPLPPAPKKKREKRREREK